MNRSILVTGAAAGVGLATAKRFASQGDRVLLVDHDSVRGVQATDVLKRQGLAVAFVACDTRKHADVANAVATAVQQHEGLDVLICNAGIERSHAAHEWPIEAYDAVIDTNLRGPFLFVKEAFAFLAAHKGVIVHVASVQGFAVESGSSVYGASKAALLGLMRGQAVDFAAHGVRVNAVCPGPIETNMMEAVVAGADAPSSIRATIAASVPMGRIGDADEVAAAIEFLASPSASYITGTSLVVDGGMLARLPR